MTDVRLPRWKRPGSGTVPEIPLRPTAMSVNLNLKGLSDASITLPASGAYPAMHDWVEIFTRNGSAGWFRVTNIAPAYPEQVVLTLHSAMDVFQDSLFEAQTDFSGTVSAFLTEIISHQTQYYPWASDTKYFQLGTCECTGTISISLNHNRLLDLLTQIEDDNEGYRFAVDFSTVPWTLNFVALDDTVATEFRLGRNTDNCKVTVNDNDLCTRLILSVNKMSTAETTSSGAALKSNATVIRTYNNTAAQAVWGVVTKGADIDTNDDFAHQSYPEADAWAQKFLADRAAPTVQIQIGAQELARYTFSEYDETHLGLMARVCLPDYDQYFCERVVSIQYPDVLGDPARVTVSLCNKLPKFSENVASLQKAAAAAGAAARAAARVEKEVTSWSQVVTKTLKAADATGIVTMYESGIEMDAETGVRIFTLEQGITSLNSSITLNKDNITLLINKTAVNELGEGVTLKSMIEQQADRISLVVEGSGQSASIKIGSIVDEINSSAVQIDAAKIYLNGTVLATALDAAYIRTDNITATTSNVGVLYVAGIYAKKSGNTGGTVIAPTVSASEVLRIGSSGGGQGSASGSLYYQGNEYVSRKLSLGAANNYIAMGNVLSTGSGDLDLNHTHTMALTEVQSGDNAGKLQITASSAVAENDGTASAYFDITTLSALSGAVSSFSVSGNVLTLNRFDGTHENFSKATVLTPGWGSGANSGVFTVVATQNGVEVGRASTSPTIGQGVWYNGSIPVYINADGGVRVTGSVSIPSTVSFSGTETSKGVFQITCSIGGTTRTGTCNINADYSYTDGWEDAVDTVRIQPSNDQTISSATTVYAQAKATPTATSYTSYDSVTLTPSGGGGGGGGNYRVNMRDAPNGSFIMYIEQGTTVNSSEDPSNYIYEWFPLKYSNQVGYVMAKFIRGTLAYQSSDGNGYRYSGSASVPSPSAMEWYEETAVIEASKHGTPY